MAAPAWLYFSFLLLLVILSYSNSVYSPFVLDDFHSFVNNRAVYAKDISLDSLKQLSTTKFGKARLIPLITFAIDHHLGAGSITQYHFTNIVIHLLCTLAVFLLIKGLLNSPVGKSSLNYFSVSGFSLLATALWSLNPVQTNGVTYLVQRMTSLATLFYVSSLVFYIYARLTRSMKARAFFYLGAILAALLSFFSKENSFTLPIAVLMVEFFFLSPGKFWSIIRSVKKHHWLLIALVILLLLPLAENYFSHRILGGYRTRFFSFDERLYTELRVIVFYISLLLLPLPSRLNLQHDFVISSSLFAPPSTFLALLLLLFLIVFALRTTKSYSLISFGILWFFLNLLIESSVIALEIIFEHRLYLSSIGFFIVIICFIDKLAANTAKFFPVKEFKTLLVCFSLLLVSVSSIFTTLRNNDWLDAIAIQTDIVKKSPDAARPYNGLGLSLSVAGRHEEALAAYEKGLELDKPYGIESLQIVNNIMIVMSETDRIEEGIARGEQYIKEGSQVMDVTFMGNFLYNLGVLYLRNEQYLYAFDAFKSSLTVDNKATVTLNAMGQLLWLAYDDPDARVGLGMAGEENDKDTTVELKLAEIMYDLRKYDTAFDFLFDKESQGVNSPQVNEILNRIQAAKAMTIARQEESSLTHHLPYRNNFGYKSSLYLADFIMTYYSPLNFTVGWFINKAGELEPNDPFVILYLNRWLVKEKQLDEAFVILSEAVEEFPDFVPILDLYAMRLRTTGREAEMVSVLKHILDIYPGHPKWDYYESLILSYKVTQQKQKAI